MNIAQNSDICRDRILILDFYSQYTQLIARRIRELSVYCEIVMCWDVTEAFIDQFNPRGIILSGSPESVNRKSSMQYYIPEYIFQANIPILGICYGMHLMAMHFGGSVGGELLTREFGLTQLEIVVNNNMLIQDICDDVNDKGNSVLNVWMSHSDKVISLPKNFVILGKTKCCEIAIMANEKKCLYGVQFHPEVTHTVQGRRILKRFVLKICSCRSLWKSSSIVAYLITYIRNVVKNDSVMLAFSGGVDSLVTALLLQRAIGNDRLICCFVNTGLLRCNESTFINEFIRKHYSLNIFVVSASNLFFDALAGITDPEEKRKIISRVFINIFEEQKKCSFPDVRWLAQGTIYPDIIESGGIFNFFKHFSIKSHHNANILSDVKILKLLEPIKNLFKDEVRDIGRELGVSLDILYRHPFPGPGFGIRILGEVKEEYCHLLRLADSIFIEELKKYNLYTKVSQAFVVFIPVRSVGVMGDVRKYEWVVSLRAIDTVDFMSARWVDFPYNFLCEVSTRIINEVHGISRVVYDISNKPPATIEWE